MTVFCLAGFPELMITLTSSVTVVIQNPSLLYLKTLFLVYQFIAKVSVEFHYPLK
jgi:hypothetical protein